VSNGGCCTDKLKGLQTYHESFSHGYTEEEEEEIAAAGAVHHGFNRDKSKLEITKKGFGSVANYVMRKGKMAIGEFECATYCGFGVAMGVFCWGEQWIAGAYGNPLSEGRVNAWWFAENHPHLSGTAEARAIMYGEPAVDGRCMYSTPDLNNNLPTTRRLTLQQKRSMGFQEALEWCRHNENVDSGTTNSSSNEVPQTPNFNAPPTGTAALYSCTTHCHRC
jgi:hypothetical protein